MKTYLDKSRIKRTVNEQFRNGVHEAKTPEKLLYSSSNFLQSCGRFQLRSVPDRSLCWNKLLQQQS